MRKRIYYCIATLLLLLVEVLIALYIHDAFVRPYVGDVLVVILIYTFIRIFLPEGGKWLPLYIFLFAAGVEILRLFHLVERLGLENNSLFRILIGSAFDIMDILCYAVGCLLVVVGRYLYGRCAKRFQ